MQRRHAAARGILTMTFKFEPPTLAATAAKLRPTKAQPANDAGPRDEVAERRKRKAAGPSAAWRDDLVVSSKGTPRGNVANAILALRSLWPGVFAFDEFSQAIRLVDAPPWDACDAPPQKRKLGEFTDADSTRVAAWLARHERIDVSPDVVWRAATVLAEANPVHPVREYLEALEWDGTSRLDRWMSTYLGAADAPYVRRVGPMMLRAAVARAMQPGCKVDTMVVLEGPQGGRKSSSIKVLCGEQWTSDSPLDFASKDRFVQLRGKWIVEIPELDGCDRADVNRIKSFLSSPVDDFRPPFGRASIRAARQCVFVGTVNPGAGGYLRDVTGNRRFWPVEVGRIDLEALARDRDQLWAEAVVDFHEGRPWWPEADDAEMFQAEQAARVVADSWEDDIAAWVDGKALVTVGDVLSKALGLHEKEKQTQAAQNRVAAALTKMGRVRKQRRVEGRPTWGYVTTSKGEG